MATYSTYDGTPIESTFLGNLDPSLFLGNLPNNTSQRILPSDLRNALFTIWDNISFKKVISGTNSNSYIGIGGESHLMEFGHTASGLKTLIGKPELFGSPTLTDDMLESDTDIFIYNLKPDSVTSSNVFNHEQFTKMSFLAGKDKDITNGDTLFSRAPYLKAQQTVDDDGNKIDFTISNENGKITIDSNDEIVIGHTGGTVTIYGAKGLGAMPAGEPGDIQLNLDNCEFDFVPGSSGSIGDYLILGASNTPYWGPIPSSGIPTLNQVLTAGNTSDGEDIILTNEDNLFIGGTGSSHSSIHYNETYSYTSFKSDGEIRIEADKFRIELPSTNPNKILKTDQHGYAYWDDPSQSTITPHGNIGDIQVKGLDGVSLDSISGVSASVGHVLTMGNYNTPHWATASGGAGIISDNITVSLRPISNGIPGRLGKYISGQVIPCQGWTFEEFIRDIAIDSIEPTVNLTTNPTQVEYDQLTMAITLNFSRTINTLGASVQSALLEWKRGSSNWITLSTSTSNGTYTHNITDSAPVNEDIKYRYTVTDTAGASKTIERTVTSKAYQTPQSQIIVEDRNNAVLSVREVGDVASIIKGVVTKRSVNISLHDCIMEYNDGSGWTPHGSTHQLNDVMGAQNFTISGTAMSGYHMTSPLSINYRLSVRDDKGDTKSPQFSIDYKYRIYMGCVTEFPDETGGPNSSDGDSMRSYVNNSIITPPGELSYEYLDERSPSPDPNISEQEVKTKFMTGVLKLIILLPHDDKYTLSNVHDTTNNGGIQFTTDNTVCKIKDLNGFDMDYRIYKYSLGVPYTGNPPDIKITVKSE